MTEQKKTPKRKSSGSNSSASRNSSQKKANKPVRPRRGKRGAPSKALLEARKKNEELVPRTCPAEMYKILEETLDNGPFIVFDIETTGGNPGRNGITEIFALRYSNGEIEDTFYSLVNPQIPIPPIVRRMTGITNSTVKDAPLIDAVMPKFLDFIKTGTLVSHNTIGDLKFIRYFADSVCKKRLENFFLCTHLLTEKLVPDAPDKSLKGLSQFLKLSSGTLHRAEADTYLTLELFKVLKTRLNNRGIQRILEGVRFQGDYESGMRLGWGVDTAKLNQLPHGPGVFYLQDHEQKILFLASAFNLAREVKKLERYTQLPRQLLRIVLQSYDVKFERSPSVFAAMQKEAEELSVYKPSFDPTNWHQRAVQTIYMAEDDDGFRIGVGAMVSGTKHAFGPLRDRKAGGALLARIATTLGFKYSRKGVVVPKEYESIIIAYFKNELEKLHGELQASLFSIMMLFRPQERKNRKELMEKIKALMEVKSKMKLESLLEMSGIVVVPDTEESAWAVYSVAAAKPKLLKGIVGDIDEGLAHGGRAKRILKRVSDAMAKHKPASLSTEELLKASALLWWCTSTHRQEGRFIPLEENK